MLVVTMGYANIIVTYLFHLIVFQYVGPFSLVHKGKVKVKLKMLKYNGMCWVGRIPNMKTMSLACWASCRFVRWWWFFKGLLPMCDWISHCWFTFQLHCQSSIHIKNGHYITSQKLNLASHLRKTLKSTIIGLRSLLHVCNYLIS